MLTRLRVDGFKNLVNVDVRFGPFTCIAGPNGVGKSNLFDAIRFLSALADHSLIESAFMVRDETARPSDVRSLFHRVGDKYDDKMRFDVEMVVPRDGTDDLGQHATSSITFLRYAVELGYRAGNGAAGGSLELYREELTHINLGEAKKHLWFPHSTAWRKTAIRGERRVPYLISTEGDGPDRAIKLHQDGNSGRPLSRAARSLPRTVLSAANAAESPTALVARREMQAWRLLQLEPSALRQPDAFSAPTNLASDGRHLPATLANLARNEEPTRGGSVLSRVANRLAQLVNDVRDIEIDRDEKRELVTLHVVDRDGTSHPARALSDGTLRFLALAVLEEDPKSQGLVCLEEPENGIHPERIPAILKLLEDIACDTQEEVGPQNPLRQVIINTHAPTVVKQVPDDSLLVAELRETVRESGRFKRVAFASLSGTWRTETDDAAAAAVVSRGALLSYLNPVVSEQELEAESGAPRKGGSRATRRVVDRPDIAPYLFPELQKQ